MLGCAVEGEDIVRCLVDLPDVLWLGEHDHPDVGGVDLEGFAIGLVVVSTVFHVQYAVRSDLP